MKHPVRHQMLQMVRKRLALLRRFADADAVSQGDIADLTLGLGTVVHDYLSPAASARRRSSASEILETNAG